MAAVTQAGHWNWEGVLGGGLQVFERFLLGDTLEECYEAVAEVANRWLDMLDTQVQFLGPVKLMDHSVVVINVMHLVVHHVAHRCFLCSL